MEYTANMRYMIENILKDGDLSLTPFTSTDETYTDYLYSLVDFYQFNTIKSKEKMMELIERYGSKFWLVKGKDIAGGVIFIMYFPEFDEWSFDAYCDMDVARSIDKKGNLPYRAARLVIDYFFSQDIAKTLYTRHDIRNRAATLLCRRLGFKEIGHVFLTDIGNYVIMKIDKADWQKRRYN